MYKKIAFVLIAVAACIASCKDDTNDNDPIAASEYPETIATIIVNKCATSGCHNTTSKDGSSGLDLSTWDKMFNGNNSGAVVIPYSPEHSTLLNFVNTDSTIGIVQKPTMPINAPSLTTQEYITLRDWIANGAPNKSGEVYFANNGSGKKYYISNQGCDLVAICDPKRNVIARYISIGNSSTVIEAPHTIKMAPDGKHWYAVFFAGNVFQKFRTSDDSLVGTTNVTVGGWSSIAFSPDSKFGYITDLNNGVVIKIDLNTMLQIGSNYNVYNNAHGIAINPVNGYLYVTDQYSNYINKCDPNDLASPECVPLFPGAPCSDINSYNPHEILFTPDSSKYFITCEFSNEVRILNSYNDSLIAVIPTGNQPKEMSLSLKHPYLFVSCTETPNSNSKFRGSVAVINYLTNQKVKEITDGFFQPHGIAVNDDDDIVYVSSRNVDPNGPAPHHVSQCGGRNGFLSIIKMGSLTLDAGFKNELSVDPYSIIYKN
jgi:DNA-binding beta-propeller fold protein YncE